MPPAVTTVHDNAFGTALLDKVAAGTSTPSWRGA